MQRRYCKSWKFIWIFSTGSM